MSKGAGWERRDVCLHSEHSAAGDVVHLVCCITIEELSRHDEEEALLVLEGSSLPHVTNSRQQNVWRSVEKCATVSLLFPHGVWDVVCKSVWLVFGVVRFVFARTRMRADVEAMRGVACVRVRCEPTNSVLRSHDMLVDTPAHLADANRR